MSAKQFITAEEHLAKLEITMQQASDFIDANTDQPDLIFTTARQFGVTTNMLSEITGFSTDAIRDYFESSGQVAKRVDYTSILFNSDIGSLEGLVDFNNNVGVLSTDLLREEVKSLIDFSTVYDFPFTARYDFQTNDGIYDADELGVGHLNNVVATDENIESIESLFYGTLVNMFSDIDDVELSQIKAFSQAGDSEAFQVLLDDALSDSPETVAWTDDELADLVVNEAVYLHNHYIQDDFVVGLFDHSYLGYAPVIH